ncbi:MAG: 50S ribosomal protein L18 [Actinobacteria bacterium]|nr:50S ribosomal protein L18 [Actinomycetota bacterium]MCG2807845.1 50S ribosomal protein L18 [Coriobacteriia bacterium]MDP2232287.1 50S ribosomal protein L18 [Actinomycetota bacterium]
MDKLKAKRAGLLRRKTRVRGKVTGTATRPRLCVTRTNSNIYAQLIDDVAGLTMASASTVDSEVRGSVKSGGNIDAAKAVGELVGRRAIEQGLTEVVFDRGGRLYHGRVKALAEGARSAGLKF